MEPAVGRAVTTELDILENTRYITTTHSSCKEIFDSTSKAFICVAVTSRRLMWPRAIFIAASWSCGIKNRGVIFQWQHLKMVYQVRADLWRLTLNPLTWKIWWAPNNTSRWQVGFNSASKRVNFYLTENLVTSYFVSKKDSFQLHFTWNWE